MTKASRKRVRETVDLKEIRRLISDYMYSEGCSCCRSSDHEGHKELVARALHVPQFKDKSGWNFYKFRTARKRK